MLGLLLALTAVPTYAAEGPAFESLQNAAAASQAAAWASSPQTSAALASQSMDGYVVRQGQRHSLPQPSSRKREEGDRPSTAQLNKPTESVSAPPVTDGLKFEPSPIGRGQGEGESDGGGLASGAGLLGTASLWIGIGLFAMSTPWAAIAWGAINLAMGVSLAAKGGGGSAGTRMAGALLLGAIGITAIVAPPIGALAFIGIGAAVGLFGLYKLVKGLIH